MSNLKTLLQAPQSKGHISVARLTAYWYVACQSSDLKRGQKPLARSILGIPMVFFRNKSGRVGALLDRCPHRNIPLSYGRVKGDNIECGYHGWQFGTQGHCKVVPGLCGDAQHKGRKTPSYPVIEQDGLVWVYGEPDSNPESKPYKLPHIDDPRYTTVTRRLETKGTVHAVIENALDVPHTAFLHKGLFRGTSDPNEIKVVVRRWHDRTEAEYIGEPRPEGVVGRLLSPSGGVVTHYDRFLMPSIAQVEYSIGTENHILVTSACTPLNDFETMLHAVISYRFRVPGRLIKPVLEPIAVRIFAQDAEVLALQTETIERFGGEQFVSTDLDVLGSHIWRLMKQAERGNIETLEEPVTRELTMLV